MDHARRCKLFAVLTLLTGALIVQGVPPVQARSVRTSIQPLRIFGVGSVLLGTGSILVRTKEGVGMTLHTFGLVPGNVYTAWWIFFNNPKACIDGCGGDDFDNPDVQAVALWGSGQIAGADGTADFGAFRAVGDLTGLEPGNGTVGLVNPFKAEIHLVVRSHGPAIPALLSQQLSKFDGGCPPNTCMNLQAAMHQP